MERNEVSLHEVRVFRFFIDNPGGWFSNREITGATESVSARTVRLHTQRLAALGLLDAEEVFPGRRFRLATPATQRSRGYLDRLRTAAEVLGEPLPSPNR